MEGFTPTTYVTVRCGDTMTVSSATLNLGPAELLVPSENENGYLKLDINSAKSYFGLEEDLPTFDCDEPIDIPFTLEDVIKFGFCTGDIALVDNASLYKGNVCILCHKKLSDKFKLRRHLTSVHKLAVSSMTKDLLNPCSSQLNSVQDERVSSKSSPASHNPDMTCSAAIGKNQTLSTIKSKSPGQVKQVLKSRNRTETPSPSLSHQWLRASSNETKNSNSSGRLTNRAGKDDLLTKKSVLKSSLKGDPGSKSHNNLTPNSFTSHHNRRISGRLSGLVDTKDESDAKNDSLNEDISKILRPTKNYPNQTVSVSSTKNNHLKVSNTVNLTESSTNHDASRKRTIDGHFKCSKCNLEFKTQAHLTLHTLKDHSCQKSGPQTKKSKIPEKSLNNCKETSKGRLRGRNSLPSDLKESGSKQLEKPLRNQVRFSLDSQANRVAKRRKFHYFEAYPAPATKLKNFISLQEAINWSKGIVMIPSAIY